MRRAPVVVAFGLVLVGALLASRPTRSLLPLPPPGGVSAEWLRDGTPVFVVRDDDTVHVLGAEVPSTRVYRAVAWCPPMNGFVEVWGATRFSRDGSWLGGPSPTGLQRFATRLRGDRVEVGGALERPSRDEADARDRLGPQSDCWAPPVDLDLSVVLLHGEPFADAVSAESLRRAHASGVFTVRGVLLDHPDGSTQLCRRVSGTPPRCADRGLTLRADGGGNGIWFALEGFQRVRILRGTVTHVAMVAVTSEGHFFDPRPPQRKTADELGSSEHPVAVGRILTIPAVDIDFPGGQATLDAGQWSLRLANHGGIPHSLRMDAPVSWQVTAAPGQIARADNLSLSLGDYLLYCALPGHREAGMELRLHVR